MSIPKKTNPAKFTSASPSPTASSTPCAQAPSPDVSFSAEPSAPMMPRLTITQDADSYMNVIDVADSPDSAEAILEAVMNANSNQWMPCPVRPPFAAPARLAVSRDRRLMILALANQGLEGLRAIGLALNWVVENKQLLAMALPQLSIDGGSPMLTLLVDRADADAELLKPLFSSSLVRIQTFQRLRWGEKTGILLEAA